MVIRHSPSSVVKRLVMLLSGALVLFSWSALHADSRFTITDLPVSASGIDSISYLDLTADGWLLANGRGADTNEWCPFMIQADGSSIRPIALPAEQRAVFLSGFVNDNGRGFLYRGQTGPLLSIFSFDSSGTGQTFDVEIPSGELFFGEGVTSGGELVGSIGPEGGPFLHVTLSPTGTQTHLPPRFSPLLLEAIGPGDLLGFVSLQLSPPYVGPPSILYRLNSDEEEVIAEGEIAAIADSNRLWMRDSQRDLLWIRDRGKASRKLRLPAGSIYQTSDGGAFVNDSYRSDAAVFVSSSLNATPITCAFPATGRIRKYTRVVRVAGSRALVRYENARLGGSQNWGSALVSRNSAGRGGSYCPEVSVKRLTGCKALRRSSNIFEITQPSAGYCDIVLRFSGALARGAVPVTVNVITTDDEYNRSLTARGGVLKLRQTLHEGMIGFTIKTPRDGFKRYHSEEFSFMLR